MPVDFYVKDAVEVLVEFLVLLLQEVKHESAQSCSP